MQTPVIIGLVIVFLALVILCSYSSNITEFFQTSSNNKKDDSKALPISMGQMAVLPNGLYSIRNYQNIDLTSSAFTPVQCNNFVIGTTKPSSEKDWKLKNLEGAQGVVQLLKPAENECLYAGIDNQVKSYFYPDKSCPKKNLCGLDMTDYRGEIDADSRPTYFKTVYSSDRSKILFQSLETNKYVCLQDDQVTMKTQPDLSCVFTVNKLM